MKIIIKVLIVSVIVLFIGIMIKNWTQHLQTKESLNFVEKELKDLSESHLDVESSLYQCRLANAEYSEEEAIYQLHIERLIYQLSACYD